MNEIIQVNNSDATYYERNYNVFLWTGCGYVLSGFNVYANGIEQALEIIVTYCEREGLQAFLIDCEDIEEDSDGNYSDCYIYIDATMERSNKAILYLQRVKN